MWCVLMAAALLPAVAGAQEPTEPPPPRPDASAATPAEELAALPAEEGLLSADALDDLVAPVALYPELAAHPGARCRDLSARRDEGRPLPRGQRRPAGSGARRPRGPRGVGRERAGAGRRVPRRACPHGGRHRLDRGARRRDAGADRRPARRGAADAGAGRGDRQPRDPTRLRPSRSRATTFRSRRPTRRWSTCRPTTRRRSIRPR